MKDIFVVWHYTKYCEKEIEAVFSNEEDAISFCEAREDETVPGYCNMGVEPAYTYTYHCLFDSIEDYEEEKVREEEAYKEAEDSFLKFLKEKGYINED